MLTYSFDNTGSDSLYEHLYKCIKNDILSGELAPDYKLPSKRSFAKNLGISTITVENAYAQLIAEGYIYSLPKKGYYVTDIAAVGQPVFAASYSHSKPENTSYQIDFSTNHASGANFPFYTWAKLMKEVMSDCSSELLTPSPAAGILELREAIARHLSDFRGMKV